ncbi:MAG TPA: hypothetical protein VIL30_06560 [Ramlibacter sp.]|jgi:hypothetical protein
MKFSSILKTGVLATVLGFTGLAAAQTQTSVSVGLSVALTSVCRVTSAAPTLSFTYTAFSANVVNAAAQNIAFECTRGVSTTPTFSWTGGDIDVIAGLRYSLTATAGASTSGTAATGGAGGDIGTADTRVVSVSGSMAAGQAGAGQSTTTTGSKTLVVTF